jgi:hypothetical protein
MANCSNEPAGPAEDLRHIAGDVVAIAVGHPGDRQGVVPGDGFRETDVDHRLLPDLIGDRVRGDQPASISLWMRRRAIGECASALLVTLTTCSMPALPALSITFSSYERSGWVTRITLENQRPHRRVLGQSRAEHASRCPPRRSGNLRCREPCH